MSLRKPPTLTPALVAANRANAQKSTGPRTRRGKAQVTLNALKHGRYAGRLFRSHLLLAREEVALYDWMYRQVCHHFRPVGKGRWAKVERAAREVWCACRRARQEGLRAGYRPPSRSSVWCSMRIPTSQGGSGTNPEYAVKSTDGRVTFPFRFRLVVPKTGIRLQFWARGRRRVRRRRPLLDFSQLPPHLNASFLMKEALKRAWEAASQPEWLAISPPASPGFFISLLDYLGKQRRSVDEREL